MEKYRPEVDKHRVLVVLPLEEEIIKPINMTDWKEAGQKFPALSFPQLESDSFPVDILIGMDFINDIRFGGI